MAQLSDDCFAFNGPLMPVSEVLSLLASRLMGVDEHEVVPLASADGRVLAHDLAAGIPLPPFTNSAVDGYAVRGADVPVEAARSFPVTDYVQAGAQARTALAPGHAIRIFTGAPMPEGADTVFMQEDVAVESEGSATLPPGLKRGSNVRPAGEDIPVGRQVLQRGHRLRPQDIAVAAALGQTEIGVLRRLKVAIFSTGNEIVAPGRPRGQAQLFDSNRFMLSAMASRLGCAVTDLGILGDDQARIAGVLQEAATTHDLILTSGGVSTGEADYVKASVESVGSLVFWRVAIKPGRPVAMGVIGGTPFIGLPGNPVASFVTFALIARPAIITLAGSIPEPVVTTPVRAAFGYRKKAGRREYVRVSLRQAADGIHEAIKFPREGAGLLSSLVDTDGLVELEESVTEVKAGDIVGFVAYANLF